MKKKTARVKVRRVCTSKLFDFGIFEGRKLLMRLVGRQTYWEREKAAIRNAKAMAKRIGIPYDPEIIRQDGC